MSTSVKKVRFLDAATHCPANKETPVPIKLTIKKAKVIANQIFVESNKLNDKNIIVTQYVTNHKKVPQKLLVDLSIELTYAKTMKEALRVQCEEIENGSESNKKLKKIVTSIREQMEEFEGAIQQSSVLLNTKKGSCCEIL